MLAENVNHASAGLQKRVWSSVRRIALEFTLPPHNDGAARRVSVGIESCFQASPCIQDLIRFAVNTGLRIGEIFSLRWSDVDWENNVLNILAPKTQKLRTVPINGPARKVLDYWALGRRNEFVFYNPDSGKPFVDLDGGFALACKKAGIDGVTWHTLRHTFASRLVNRGVDIVTVQQLLGHSTITVTMRYTHTNLDSKRTAVAKLSLIVTIW